MIKKYLLVMLIILSLVSLPKACLAKQPDTEDCGKYIKVYFDDEELAKMHKDFQDEPLARVVRGLFKIKSAIEAIGSAINAVGDFLFGDDESHKREGSVYSGEVVNWGSFKASGNRKKLKSAAESMIGWGYSQSQRMSANYRDCSSFVHTALMDAGLMPRQSWAFTTFDAGNYSQLKPIKESELLPGDIMISNNVPHMAFYWGRDGAGKPMTLESCGSKGVCYGYGNGTGWTVAQYTQFYRVKGID